MSQSTIANYFAPAFFSQLRVRTVLFDRSAVAAQGENDQTAQQGHPRVERIEDDEGLRVVQVDDAR